MTDTLELRAGAARMVFVPAIGGAIAAYEWNGEPILRRVYNNTPVDRTCDVSWRVNDAGTPAWVHDASVTS